MAQEINFDGIVGPSHYYGGMAVGNLASQLHAQEISNPKAAALQGLEKMKQLYDLGVPQAVLPPQERPFLPGLRNLGFRGSDEEVLLQASEQVPQVFGACSSASCMWVANAATISPSVDTQDGRVHVTPANLVSHFHRSIEAAQTTKVLRRIFGNTQHFCVHDPLPATDWFKDEGAANHGRFCDEHGAAGVELFVYGEDPGSAAQAKPKSFPARQSYAAFDAVMRRHQLDTQECLMLQQSPEVIDQGVFHNDVISVVNQNVMLYHEKAFAHPEQLTQLQHSSRLKKPLYWVKATDADFSVADAVSSYLFNSQLVTLFEDRMVCIAPQDAADHPKTKAFMDRVIAEENPITEVIYVNLKQSMNNGGGPACLRLRVVLTEQEQAAMHQGVLLDETLYQTLRQWIEQHYPEQLRFEDLKDPSFLKTSQQALDELTQHLQLGSIYSFQ